MSVGLLSSIKDAALTRDLQMSLHAIREAHAENISPDDIRQALMTGQILEDYPEHRRGSCCLIYGDTHTGRPIHIVCTTHRNPVLIITVYRPALPKWITPTQRKE